ncbi:MAG TPA: hypothetical protein VNA32_07360 [Actinomycetota bacterium]|nr:hypothetical protein [Actinomycetota bacterium]
MIPAFVRQHVTRTGKAKVAYETEALARNAGHDMNPRQYAYRCSLCGAWHLSKYDLPIASPKVPWFQPEERERAR